MKELNKLSIVFVLVCAGLNSICQNPGYVDKQYVFGFGMILPNQDNFSKPFPIVSLEHSMSFQSSWRIGATYRSLSTRYEDYNYVFRQMRNFVPSEYSYTDVFKGNPFGPIDANVVGLDFSLRRYLPKFGSIAPYGYFTDFSICINHINIIRGDAYLSGTYLKEPILAKIKLNQRNSNAFSSAFNFGLGKKMFLNNNGFLEYQVSCSFHMDNSINDGLRSATQVAKYIVKRENADNIFAQIKMIYGFAF